MPKRVIDFDAMWGSDKLASCAEWAQAEYAWLYGLADASGCFELTNLRVIWGRVAAIRRNLTIERLEQVFGEFQDKGLLFVWEHEGKRYGHWTGSDVPGRLPPPSWRMRLERLAPPVPKKQFAEYVAQFARGRASLPGGGFHREPEPEYLRNDPSLSDSKIQSANVKVPTSDLKSGISQLKFESDPASTRVRESESVSGLQSLKAGLEEGQPEDWNWDGNKEWKGKGSPERLTLKEEPFGSGDPKARGQESNLQRNSTQPLFPNRNINSENARNEVLEAASQSSTNPASCAATAGVGSVCAAAGNAARAVPLRDKSFFVAKELIVGRGPSCGPVKVKPEALERIRARNAARDGSRSP